MEENQNNISGYGWIIKNILGAALFFVALALIAHILLGIFTNHGKSIEVPDMYGLSVKEATAVASSAGLKVLVTDSIYVRKMPKGAVYKQNPSAGSSVKNGRRIRLTINTVVPKQVTMPNLRGQSMRQAIADLKSKGLTVGKLIYVEDIATNNVLRQLYKNREIAPGRSVESGSAIDLEVGLNESDNTTFVPDVKGLKYERAIEVLHEKSLNIGSLVFDDSVKSYQDSIDAVVYRQSPTASQAPIPMGSDVSVYLSKDKK